MMTEFLLLLALSAAARPQPPVRVTRCGISLALPRHWKATPARNSGDKCTFGVHPSDWARLRRQSTTETPEEAITVTVTKRPFTEVAQEHFMTVGEHRRRLDEPDECKGMAPETWLLPGGQGSTSCQAAKQVSNGEFQGIAGEASYGRIEKGTGQYAGLGEWYSATVSNGVATVIIEDESEFGFNDTFLPLVLSIRAAPPAPSR